MPRDARILTNLMYISKDTYNMIREDKDRLLWYWLSRGCIYKSTIGWIRIANVFSQDIRFNGRKIVIHSMNTNRTMLSDNAIYGITCCNIRFLRDIKSNNGIGITDGMRINTGCGFIGMSYEHFEYSIGTKNIRQPYRSRYLNVKKMDIITLIHNKENGMLYFMVNFDRNNIMKYGIPKSQDINLFIGITLHNNSIEVLDHDELTHENVSCIMDIITCDSDIVSSSNTHTLYDSLRIGNMDGIIYNRHEVVRQPEKLMRVGLDNGHMDCIKYLMDYNILHVSHMRSVAKYYLINANRTVLEFMLINGGKGVFEEFIYLEDILESFPDNKHDVLRWILMELIDGHKLRTKVRFYYTCVYRYLINVVQYIDILIEHGVDCEPLGIYAKAYGIKELEILYPTTNTINRTNHEDFKVNYETRYYDKCQWLVDNVPGFKDELYYQLILDNKSNVHVLNIIDDTLYSCNRLLEYDDMYLQWIIDHDTLTIHCNSMDIRQCINIINMYNDSNVNVHYRYYVVNVLLSRVKNIITYGYNDYNNILIERILRRGSIIDEGHYPNVIGKKLGLYIQLIQ